MQRTGVYRHRKCTEKLSRHEIRLWYRPVTSFLLEMVPSLLLPFSFPLPSFPPCPFFSSLPFLSSLPFPFFPVPTPEIRLGDLGSAVSFRSGSGWSPAAKSILVQLKVKISQITLINWHVLNIPYANKYAPLCCGGSGTPWPPPLGYGPVIQDSPP